MESMNKIAVLLAAAVLGGCATSPKPIYDWNQYQPVIYQYSQKDSSIEQQISELNQTIEQSRQKGTKVPPGLHAHLGMLYANTGRNDEAERQFQTEKSLFPESISFMDFLLSKGKGKAS
ncbi:DUF4810 domain-containing protein [Yersinia ruckeri]|uniref:Putative lipoprotein n=1 Tax=Yersinia ruckeri TaxID=29486 RepID=A0A085U844_YERRU|nr:DUF4810 domain-containing protein [Yersinia ruckeri]AKA37413.1 lipoprotein [Yersinia ruckeri]ARZ00836.1 lipoprotein [Yersinia ruckeri]AUQ42933.1 DUF4810 domain-containing protein [Yersinia ruckeri]EKN3346482.1 DUF4810 domain-containing protein [Yersinia ruckeri]EKN3360978.1 DUF4810 domain-containing protein [Yersinia ruckeri]